MSSDTAAIAELSHPTHACLIYQNPMDRVDIISEFLARGLTRGEMCLYLERPSQLGFMRRALQDAGVQVESEEERGALVITDDLGYLDHGHFNGRRTVQFLDDLTNKAIQQGYTALRASGDMNWELGQDQDFKLLVDYEAELDAFIQQRPIIGLCQYQRMTLPGLAIENALSTHDKVIMDKQFCANNLFYQPPELRLEQDPLIRLEKRVEWMCQRLTQSMRSEKQRDVALRALIDKQFREAQAAGWKA